MFWGGHRRPSALKYRAGAQNLASWNSPADPGGPGGPGGPGEVVSWSATQTPLSTRAGGQDDVSSTNSLK